jgi:hypothetical protein
MTDKMYEHVIRTLIVFPSKSTSEQALKEYGAHGAYDIAAM